MSVELSCAPERLSKTGRGRTAKPAGWVAVCLTVAVLRIIAIDLHAEAEPTNSPPHISVWDKSFNIRAGFGFKDNVLLSEVNKRDSAFVLSGFDAMLLRLPIDGPQVLLFVSGDDQRYLSDVSVNKEQSLIALSRIQKEFAGQWEAGLALEYFYQDQVFDVSATEADLSTLQLQAHSLKANPSLERKFAEHYHLKLELPITRQYLRKPLDDYWEGGPKLTFQRDYGNRSSAWVSYEFSERLYDERHETDDLGNDIPGTSLKFQQHEFELGSRHFWDEKRRWRTETKVAYELNLDSGDGFFDYHRYQGSEQLRYTAATWMVRGQAKVNYYDYHIQPVTAGDSETRHYATLGFNLRGEKNLTKALKLYAEYDFEQALSNRETHEYEANTVLGGLDWEF
jgi:hypothetical protein